MADNLEQIIGEHIATLGEDDLRSLNQAVIGRLKCIRDRKAAQNRMSFHVGDLVAWSSRRGSFEGEVTRVKRKYAHVQVGPVNWNVPLSMLQAV